MLYALALPLACRQAGEPEGKTLPGNFTYYTSRCLGYKLIG